MEEYLLKYPFGRGLVLRPKYALKYNLYIISNLGKWETTPYVPQSQCPRANLNTRFLPRAKTTTA